MNTSGARIIWKKRQICEEIFEDEVQKCLLHGEAAIDVEMVYEQMKTKGSAIKVRTLDGTVHKIEKKPKLAWIKRRILADVQHETELNKASMALIQDVLSAESTLKGLGDDGAFYKPSGALSENQGTISSPSIQDAISSKDTANLAGTSDLQTSSLRRCVQILVARLQTEDDSIPSNIWISNDTAFLHLASFAVSHCLRPSKVSWKRKGQLPVVPKPKSLLSRNQLVQLPNQPRSMNMLWKISRAQNF
eukprot:scaffold2688_cov157-Amphora_coffeaeformis.AAC.2